MRMGNAPLAEAHEVTVPCTCDEDAEHCRMSLYVSDVRIAYAIVEQLREAVVRLVQTVTRLTGALAG